jgi:leucyl-tRNA synthetase
MDEIAPDAIATLTSGAELPFRYGARLAAEIELRWQQRWQEEHTFYSANPRGPLAGGFEAVRDQPKFYVLDMFPYPSGIGLHVGHPLGYIGSDVFGRYLRMTGHHVLHTFGYDAFGLPAEQYAISTGQHPAVTIRANIATMRGQLRRLGMAHDPRREIATTDPGFYRWTQWIFLQIFNSWFDPDTGRARPIGGLIAEFETGQRQPGDGRTWADRSATQRQDLIDSYRLAYLATEPVNWCPGLGTVLANEEVTADGRSDVGNYPVFRRPLRQWMLRITAFADRLISDLDLVDWPESIKIMQRNWIGASDGADIDLPLVLDKTAVENTAHNDAAGPVRVFTTRPDTLPGATFVVLSPEHPRLDRLVASEWPDGTPAAWRYPEGRGSEPDWTPRAAVAAYQAAAGRQQRGGTQKSGVFTGSYVVNPASGGKIPVFVADYVLMGYGSGAIMAVPAHDQRDLDFAREFGLPVQAVVQPPAPWLAERALAGGAPAEEWPEAYTGDGTYVNSASMGIGGSDSGAGIQAAIQWLMRTGHGRRVRSYRLRDWLFSRQRYWGEPIPIVYDDDGRPIALPADALPVRLPEMTDFRPQPLADEFADPVPPLARAADWSEVELDLGDGPRRYRRELNTMPQWAGSCWYYLRYLDPDNDEALVDPEIERYWMTAAGAPPGEGGVDLYVGGVEHAVLHLLYARFWHKVLYDLGHVSTPEPFRRLYNQGYILADAFTDERGMYVPADEVVQAADGAAGSGSATYQGRPVTRRSGKMGKSLKNGVSPDDIYTAYGADTLRLYEMAMGPLDADRPWRTNDIVGVHRFLQRLWRSLVDEQTGALRVGDQDLDAETLRLLHHTIMVVRKDFEALRFNTAIARLMELTTHAAKVAGPAGTLPAALAEPLVLMVAPLAPHIAEELWSRLGHAGSVAYAAFPEADPALAAAPVVTLPVQINGRARFTIEVPADASPELIEQMVADNPGLDRHIRGMTVHRMIVVPGKIVNVVAR